MWIGGILHRDSGRAVLFTLPDRSADSLLHHIKEHIPAGSLVCTDKGKGYTPMPPEYTHHRVNHSKKEYVKTVQDPTYGEVMVTTDHIEDLWRRYRNFLANKQLRTMDRVISGNMV
jgi:predicted double-glycine peptidase